MCGAAGARAGRGGTFSPGEGSIHMDNVQCTGEEESIFDCPRTTNLNCRHFEDAGVFCEGQLWFFSVYNIGLFCLFPCFLFFCVQLFLVLVLHTCICSAAKQPVTIIIVKRNFDNSKTENFVTFLFIRVAYPSIVYTRACIPAHLLVYNYKAVLVKTFHKAL